MIYLLAFLASGTVVVLAGTALARHADAIAGATPLGRWWVGTLLLAGATSLPELATDITAVYLGAVDLAAGDLVGSSLANMLIFAMLTVLPAWTPEPPALAPGHVLTAGLAILLNALAAAFVLLRLDTGLPLDLGALLLFILYALGTRAAYLQQISVPVEDHTTLAAAVSLRRPALGFLAAALIVLLAAPVFAWSAKGLAAISGLGNTFVGTWLVGLATSLPELVASIAALRLGAFELALGNLFGSNAFNMAIFLPLDLVHPGDLFAALDPAHAISGLFAVVLMSVALGAIIYRPRLWPQGPRAMSVLMLALYGFALWSLAPA